MRYDVLLTNVGSQSAIITTHVMEMIQGLAPVPVVNLDRVENWLVHVPILLRRGISGDDARDIQQQFEKLGAAVAIIPTRLFFPSECEDITDWRNEWFSEHLVALHERVFSEWAQEAAVQEGYRFSFLPALGVDVTVRVWESHENVYAVARRSIGSVGPMPGPPAQNFTWTPSLDEWDALRYAMNDYRFWESQSWNTVPDGYSIIGTTHWIVEGYRSARYHVLVDQTPNEGAAREVGLMLLDLLPDNFTKPYIE